MYILALDQGTTSCRTLLLDAKGHTVHSVQQEFAQHFPQKGWVEHDAEEIWQTQWQTLTEVIKEAGISVSEIKAIGITNQRETTIAWNRKTGRPLCNAIVWQDKRTAAICEQLRSHGLGEVVRKKTGLVVDAYFSATKMMWILQNVQGARELADKDELCLGTIDSWLLWKLTEGKVFKTDVTNASRTMLFDIHKLRYDKELIEAMDIPNSALPKVVPSIGHFGNAKIEGHEIPVTGIAGDQQAALFGQACFEPGMVKNTYGTGCFMLMNTGKKPRRSKHGMITTIAWSDGDETSYALEGSVFIAGAAVQWLRDGLKLIDSAPDSEYFARQANVSEPVYVVPAFSGLGAPYWDMYARGAIFGLTRDTGKNELVRATLESMAYQTKDVLDAMVIDAGVPIRSLRVDGGASANDLLMQFQADLLGTEVDRPVNIETTALGAGYMAGLGSGLWSKKQLKELRASEKVFRPRMEGKSVEKLYRGWKKAVERSKQWLDDES
jgi:glycerol kinase